MSATFSIDPEISTGRFERQAAHFRGRVERPAAGRYHLYVALACPWSHRTVIVRELKGLQDAIGISYAHPFRDERGWAFPGGAFVDDVNGWSFLSEAYTRSDPSFEGRVTVPVLWDKQLGVIVSNESQDIVRMLNGDFDELAERPELDLYPEDLRAEVDRVNEVVYRDVNNGVYRAGFATSQDAYDEAFTGLF